MDRKRRLNNQYNQQVTDCFTYVIYFIKIIYTTYSIYYIFGEENHMAANALPPGTSEKDQREIQDIYAKIRTSGAKLVGPDGNGQALPPSLYSFLCTVLGDLKDGYPVTILQPNASLTTVEAGKLLGISRTHFVGLLKENQIPFHMVGTHRRVLARDVLVYKAKRDIGRRKTLDDLALAEHEEGLYDRVPD